MATLRDIRLRIVGVRKTQKITRAMKMVAAARLRRAQTAVVAARPYARATRGLLDHLAATGELAGHPLVVQREIRSAALIVVTSDRGLAGPFNANLLRAMAGHIAAEHAERQAGGKLRIYCVGKKGVDYLTRRRYSLAGKYLGVYSALTFGTARSIAREVVNAYVAGEIDRVEIVYNEFKSVAHQKIVIEPYLPLAPAAPAGGRRPAADYLYEPDRPSIVEALIPRYLEFELWRILLESNAAEQGSRMAAMENATENANEMISSLQLSYNKARQASITKELLEVVGGADALQKGG